MAIHESNISEEEKVLIKTENRNYKNKAIKLHKKSQQSFN
jgi:hypothetical protein